MPRPVRVLDAKEAAARELASAGITVVSGLARQIVTRGGVLEEARCGLMLRVLPPFPITVTAPSYALTQRERPQATDKKG